uniref:Phospholipid/glycerol acyltransferase domain-containing protein n=1 Tax=Acrobeloides nanus TaxID=290746 RepID=A0A914DS41_9BILA
MNHRTRLDWMFFWNVLYKMDPWLLTTEKIILKAGLKFIPGAGWAMGCNAFTFLNRNHEKDLKNLEIMLKYYKDSRGIYQILLFPEGTDRGTRAVQISHEFADKHGLPRYHYVLHPRITGFNLILNNMRKNNYINYVYDVTVGYPGRIISSEMELIKKGLMPNSVHFDVKKYEIKDIVEHNDNRVDIDASKWLLDLWKNKEERLRKFYEIQEKGGQPKFEPSGDCYVWPIETMSLGYYVAFLVWILSSIMWIYFTIYISWVKIYVICAVIFYCWADWRHGGVDQWLIEWFYGKPIFHSQ